MLLGAILAGALVLCVVVAGVLVNLARTTPPSATPSGTSTETAATQTPSTAPSTPPPPPVPAPLVLPGLPVAPMNILLIGSDIRGNAREATEHAAATGERADQRSDVLMLIHIPADHRRIYGISIMRDLWVDIPGYGGSKINAALDIGGPPLVAETVGGLLTTRIDHTVMVDFNSFKALTDSLGGIEVNVTLPFTSTHDTGHVFPEGVNRLDGQAALEFVRERYAFADGDYQRVRNQQTFVRAVMSRMVSSGTLNDPAQTLALITSVAPYIIVDRGFDPLSLAGLAYGLRGTDPGSALFMTLPTAGSGWSADGQSIIVPDYGGIAEVGASLAADDLAGYAAARGL